MFPKHQISILEWILKDHVTLKTAVMMLKIYLWHQLNFKILQDPKALNVSVFDVLCVYLCPHLFPREHTQFFQELVDVSIQSTAFYWCFSGPVDGSIQWINHQTENLLLCLEKYLNPMTRHRPSAYLIRDARYLTISCYCHIVKKCQ